ncbi:MAG: aminotransferase class V-fold PLP-dependent enzyme, partial [Bacteroidetes bacterium]
MPNHPLTEAEIKRLRAETEGTGTVAHFNHAGASLMPDSVRDAVIDWIREESLWGGYEVMASRAPDLEQAYGHVARLIGAEADEIAFTESATDGWNQIFYAFDWKPGDEVITTEAEYGSNYIAFLNAKRRFGIEIRVVPSCDPEAVEAALSPRTRMISLTYIPTHSGLVQPAAAVGQIAAKYGIPFLLDACQAAGQLPIDVKALRCDFLSAAGRKYLRGPRGSGFLYVRREWISHLQPPMPDGFSAQWLDASEARLRSDARRFEQFEASRANRFGLGLAAEYALNIGLERIYERIVQQAAKLRSQLRGIPEIQVQDAGSELCGIVTFTHARIDSPSLQRSLLPQRINVSVTPRTGALLDFEKRGLPEMIRSSVHYLTS